MTHRPARRLGSGLALLVLLAAASPARGNAYNVTWNPTTGGARPVDSEHLVLERESVVFAEGRVDATFRIRNTSDEAVTTDMGFPLADDDPNSVEAYRERSFTGVHVLVDGEPVDWTLKKDLEGDYPVALAWSMTFPAGAITRLRVQHPLRYRWNYGEATEADHDIHFDYVTHTGAYWAEPIGRATFRFCDERVMRWIARFSSDSTWWNEELDETLSVSWEVSPEPTRIDRDRGCIVWERTDWVPEKDADDLSIDLGLHGSAHHYPSDARLYSRWCGLDEHRYAGVNQTPAFRPGKAEGSPHLAVDLDLDETRLDEERLAGIREQAFRRVQNVNPPVTQQHGAPARVPVRDELPRHQRLRIRLELVRYLRGWLQVAGGGHPDHPRLFRCFANHPAGGDELSPTGRANLKWLRTREQRLEEEMASAREALSDRIVPPDAFEWHEHVDERRRHAGPSSYLEDGWRVTPHPADDTPLRLERLDLLLQDDVLHVRLRIDNPSGERVTTPLALPEHVPEGESDPPFPPPEVFVDGELLSHDPVPQLELGPGERRTVDLRYDWTDYRHWSRDANPNGYFEEEWSFRYGVGLEGFANERLPEARFRLCRPKVLERLRAHPEGTSWQDETAEAVKRVTEASMEPDHPLDEGSCFRWTRTDWQPERFGFRLRITKTGTFYPTGRAVRDRLCARTDDAPHYAAALRLDERRLTPARWRDVLREVWSLLMQPGARLLDDGGLRSRLATQLGLGTRAAWSRWTTAFAPHGVLWHEMPPDARAWYEGILVRYLRGWLDARAGRSPEAARWRTCFHEAPGRDDGLGDVAQRNRGFVQERLETRAEDAARAAEGAER